ncbi:asparaginase [Arthrobacter sp. zg-Y411]|uniref:asparaginase n=1 Tax=Arthrobacter zhangbolii TaxID=2886936 RepID=UPI001D13E56E|nr:asparaginase [Arthrobacter zhangbolii]
MASIVVLGTGGTIASRGQGPEGAVAADGAASLAASLSGRHTVTTRDILTTGSYRLDLGNLRTIAEAASAAVAQEDVDGVVVTHGTDTMEETAFLLDLVHAGSKPVVFTGAQQPADSANPDGPQNLAEAVEAAAEKQLHGTGVLISFAGTVRTARGARKAHTTAASPFAGGTEVAHLAGNDVVVAARPDRCPPLPLPGAAFDAARVEIITAYPGATPNLLRHAAADGAQAVVLAGTGIGNAGPGFAEAVADLTGAGVHVILASRTPWGPVIPTYGNGGGKDLVRAGAVTARTLNPFQSRILAALLLALDPSPETFPERFSAYA